MLEGLAQPFTHYSRESSPAGKKISVISATTGMPGVTNLLLFPFEAVNNVNAIRTAHKVRDRESMIDATIRTISVPFMVGNGLGVSFDMLTEIHLLTPHAFAAVSLGGSIAGMVICVLELIIESLSLIQVQLFSKQINKNLLEESSNILKKPIEEQHKFLLKVGMKLHDNKEAYTEIFGEKIYEEFLFGVQKQLADVANGKPIETAINESQALLVGLTLSFIQSKYLQLTPNDQAEITESIQKQFPECTEEERRSKINEAKKDLLIGRKSMLSRRVSTWLAQDLEEGILPILKDLTSSSPDQLKKGLSKAETLINQIHMQNDKKTLIHSVGIACLVILLIALTCSTCGVSAIAVISLYSIGFTLALARFILYKGLLKSKTWEIHWEKVPPKWCVAISNFMWGAQKVEPKKIKRVKIESPHNYLDRHHQWKKLDRRIQAYI